MNFFVVSLASNMDLYCLSKSRLISPASLMNLVSGDLTLSPLMRFYPF
jgi:hypothetical protein